MVCDKCSLLHFDYSKFFKVKHLAINKRFKLDHKKATIFMIVAFSLYPVRATDSHGLYFGCGSLAISWIVFDTKNPEMIICLIFFNSIFQTPWIGNAGIQGCNGYRRLYSVLYFPLGFPCRSVRFPLDHLYRARL